MLTKICKKSDGNKYPEYYCADCDYKCSKKFLFTQHCSTKKHKNRKMLANARKNMHFLRVTVARFISINRVIIDM